MYEKEKRLIKTCPTDSIVDAKINNVMLFINPDGREVGRFEFNKDKLEFMGTADESAEIFIDKCLRTFNGKIQDLKGYK